MRTVTAATLITRIRDRIDRPVDDDFITDTELLRYIDSAYTELYDILAEKGIGQYEKTTDVTSTGTDTYTLPTDFYGVMGVDVQLDSTNWVELPRAMFSERNVYSADSTGYARTWRIYTSEAGVHTIKFYPAPESGQVYRVYYIPVAGTIDDTADTVDGVNGYEEFIVVEAAIKCFIKEESSTTVLERERQYWLDKINAAAENRIQASPNRVVDVEPFDYDPADWWPRQWR